MEKYGYEKVLGDIACYIANKCSLSPSEAVSIVMNDERTTAVVKEIEKASDIDVELLASRYLEGEVL